MGTLKKENEFYSSIKRAELTESEEAVMLYRLCNWLLNSRVLDAEQIVTFRRCLIGIIKTMKEERENENNSNMPEVREAYS